MAEQDKRPKTGGRQKGSLNRSTVAIQKLLMEDQLLEEAEAGTLIHPFVYLLRALSGTNPVDEARVKIAIGLLPYTNKKMPTQVESTIDLKQDVPTLTELYNQLGVKE